ncbi:calcium permeable stress-gated cation channel 1 isoform X2 [Bacillus rossius redtenbacheri]|uniref:calcium permeable stress-gated cation channel 1 isoform X2 n=2 Tax=Bacillus rossius redtenbacheri TaxID=93214 RepID=UPI002FDEAFE1
MWSLVDPGDELYAGATDADTGQCNYLSNTTHKILLTSVYEGIPENLLVNFLGWLILIILFAILRKKAWNYGRIALVQKNEERWTQLFYGAMEDTNSVTEVDSITSVDSSLHTDKGFCSLFSCSLRDENILHKCGPDAVQYLSFQRHILFLMSVITVVSVGIVLPVNFQGLLQGNETTFGHTTLSNLDPNSPLLWLHVTLAILYLPLGIAVMRRFSARLQLEEQASEVSRTLMVCHIPRRHCDTSDISRHFRDAYPEIEVQNIQLAYDITRVSRLDKKREQMHEAKVYCENFLKRTGTRLTVRPHVCGNVCGGCDLCGCPAVDGLEYYAEEEARLASAVESGRLDAFKKPLGIAFVTLASVEAARRVYSDHQSTFKCANNPPNSSVSSNLQPHRWVVSFAPSPKDIYWENLSVPSKYWYVKAVMVNLFLFLFLFFLTTPAIVVNFLNTHVVGNRLEKISPVVSEFLPTLLLWTVSALMPVLVSYSDQWLSHWTRSDQNLSIMRKTLVLLLFMVLVLPSLGLASADALLKWSFRSHNETYRWECLFLPDKGAFFVNYVITSSFIGTGLELIRFPELFMYAACLLLARSRAETASVRKAILYEFPFGVHYAWMLLIFALTITYSLSCPLITPFGLLYMCMKHLVDRYNLYFAYRPSKINPRTHASAINTVIFSIVLLQLSFLALSVLRRGMNDISIYSLVGVCITVGFLMAQIFLDWCKGFSPISYQKQRGPAPTPSADSSPAHQFVPPVMQMSPEHHARPEPVLSVTSPAEGLTILQRTYGTRAAGDSRDHVVLYQDYDGSNAEVSQGRQDNLQVRSCTGENIDPLS